MSPRDPYCRIKTACSWAGGSKAALGGVGMVNAGPVQELVGLLSAEVSVSAAPFIKKTRSKRQIKWGRK